MAVPTKEAIQAGVKDWMKLQDGDNQALVLVSSATHSFVSSLPIAADDSKGDDVLLGAVMLASRLFRRRNSPGGVEAMTEAGATYVARTDSDVSRLLQLDVFQPPRIG